MQISIKELNDKCEKKGLNILVHRGQLVGLVTKESQWGL